MYEIIKNINDIYGHEKIRQRSVNRYLNNPNFCKNCNELIKIKIKDRICDVRKKKFCSRSCSVIYNNKGRTKNSNSKYYSNYCKCGKKKRRDSIFCQNCRWLNNIEKFHNKTLREVKVNTASRNIWNRVRLNAKQVLKLNNIKKECYICKFNFIVHVCHIKSISSFDENTKIEIVNSIDNLVYLCPNHHAMLDNNIISLLRL